MKRSATSYFDYIENQIEQHNTFTMEQFAANTNKFLVFNDYQILTDKGHISTSQAKPRLKMSTIFSTKLKRIDSGFDKQVRGMLGDK